MIEASHFDANEAYAAVDRHRLEDYEPYIYRTRDARQDVAEDHQRPAGRRLHADGEGGSEAARPARRRHRARRVRLVQRRRRLAVAAAQPAAVVDARPRVQGQRSDRRDPRPRLLGARRHQRAAPGRRRTSRRPTRTCSSRPTRSSCRRARDDGTPTQKDEPEARESADRRDHRLLPEGRRGRAGDARDPRRAAARRSAATRAPIRCRRSIRTRWR